MSLPQQVYLDFARPTRRKPGIGYLLCVAGLACATVVGVAFSGVLAERAHLQAQLMLIAPRHRAAASAVSTTPASEAELHAATEALSTPWSALLAELEAASQDFSSQVAILQVQPDAQKHVVHITAEVRNLPDAFAYLQRLQKSRFLEYPMLESHERRKDDPQHPLRITLAAQWRR